ncbi:MAG: tetratricopeptide repeat protein [Prevotella sp.]|nr:tetratricopeptide repeat protein [Prevotella sp.]
MRHSGYYIILLLLTALSVSSYADNRQARKLIRKGNALYRADKRQEAQVDYLKAYRADSTDARVQYNLATSMFPQDYKLVQKERCDTMAMMFERAAQAETNPLRKAKAYHNEGVAYQGVKDFGKAIEAYKNALRCNPNDDESRYNLVLCQRQLKNQGGGNNNQQQDKQDQQDKQQQQQQQEKQKKQEKQQQQQEPPMSKENAEQLLNAAMQREKETQKRMKEAQQQPQRRRIEKNW